MSSKVLELNQSQLETLIQTELNENPALERLDFDDTAPTDEEILRKVAPQELKPGGNDRELMRSLPTCTSDELDWLDLASTSDSLDAHLRGQLVTVLPASHEATIDFVVASVNARGYLETTPEEAALATGVSFEVAEEVIAALRLCEPAGVGAFDLRDCLMLQLREAETLEERLAFQILESRFDDLVQRNVRALARAFRAVPDVIQQAIQVITELQPFPGEQFRPHIGTHHSSSAVSVIPDMVFGRNEFGWDVEIRGADPIHFTISRAYQSRRNELAGKKNVDAGEARHLQQFMDRAEWFIASLGQRKATLAKIGHVLAEEQAGFLNTGEVKFLRPMTRAKLAETIGIHESAMSRAVADKFIQLATGEIVPFEMFFNSALRVQKAIQEILETENPHRPLSDERIAQMLAEQGIVIARRTVNKYRDKSRLLSSRRRKSA
ncbi:MAG: RNA polymerase factor sigma-54 [Chthonomonas sp.]|nr:RNA polymerase factor sigma-54 [Chthonomonas sp.]